jgi:hypothetical protein
MISMFGQASRKISGATGASSKRRVRGSSAGRSGGGWVRVGAASSIHAFRSRHRANAVRSLLNYDHHSISRATAHGQW